MRGARGKRIAMTLSGGADVQAARLTVLRATADTESHISKPNYLAGLEMSVTSTKHTLGADSNRNFSPVCAIFPRLLSLQS
jgi:hypothetical protein